jgi:hypothetical protein
MSRTRLLFAIVLISAGCFATTVIPMSVERLTTQSTHVVFARALDHRSAWNPDHTRIFTYTRFQVMQTLKGNPTSLITVKQLGGHADGYNMKVAGVRYFANGEDAVLFLQKASDSTFSVTGLMQGDFRLGRQSNGEVVVSNGVPDAKELAATGEVQQYHGARMSLEELRQRVIKVGQ